jgi:hypothetical protein
MKFDPTFDYGNSDLKIDENLVCWKFGGLVKNLITLSCSSKKQIDIIGISGMVCNEMAIDFDTYFTLSFHSYLKYNLLSDQQLEKFIELENFFNRRRYLSEFWEDLNLDTNAEWETIRQKADYILKTMGMQNLTIKIERKEKYEMINKVKLLKMQSTKTKLIKKNER